MIPTYMIMYLDARLSIILVNNAMTINEQVKTYNSFCRMYFNSTIQLPPLKQRLKQNFTNKKIKEIKKFGYSSMHSPFNFQVRNFFNMNFFVHLDKYYHVLEA